ncbi:hypothetical protein [Janthinobacterium sp.]|uniref:hypothetical protein n=1 Tax=Janthinobacterium sp. TaxID=1871054 RepID=UPI00293D87A3|nr:hypothetical protein [Janthinobacterium sp.]
MKPSHSGALSLAATLLCALAASPAQAQASAGAPPQLSADTPPPAPPGAAGKATLAGVDANGNGVRDDLEPFLLSHFGKRPQVLRAVSNFAISVQAAISTSTEQESSRAHSMAIRAGECFGGAEGAAGEDAATMEELGGLLMNTPQREAAMRAHTERIANLNFAVRNNPRWEAYCLLRADQVDNAAQAEPRRE